MTDPKSIVDMLGTYLEIYPESKLSAKGLAMYSRPLRRYSLEQIRIAMDKLSETSEFFPKPVHIIKAINDLAVHVATEGRGIPDAGEAFREMLEQAKRHSVFTDKWEFSTPEVEMAVKRFGKMEILYLPESEIGIARAQFRKIYEEELNKQRERKVNDEVLKDSRMTDLVNKLAGKSKVLVLEGRT